MRTTFGPEPVVSKGLNGLAIFRPGNGGQGQDITLGMALLNTVAFDFFNQRSAIQLK